VLNTQTHHLQAVLGHNGYIYGLSSIRILQVLCLIAFTLSHCSGSPAYARALCTQASSFIRTVGHIIIYLHELMHLKVAHMLTLNVYGRAHSITCISFYTVASHTRTPLSRALTFICYLHKLVHFKVAHISGLLSHVRKVYLLPA